MHAKVSIIIPTYNQEKYLEEAINSACNQTYKNIEIIIVNDGSTDNSEKIIFNAYSKNSNIHYIKQENKGLAKSRNRGIEESTGEYIAFLDSDDYWKSEKIEVLVNYMIHHEQVGLVHTQVQVVNEKSEKADIIYSGKEGNLYYDLITFEGLNIPPPSSIMIKREVIDKVGMFDPNFKELEDQDFYIRVAKHFKIGKVDRVLGYYRIHYENMHKDNVRIEKGFLNLLEKIKGYGLPKNVLRKSIAKAYILVAIIRWKSKKNVQKVFYYLLISFISSPLFFLVYFYKNKFRIK